MGNECCVSRAGSKCDVNSTGFSVREGGRDEGVSESGVGRRGVRGGSGAGAVGSTLVPNRHCQAAPLPLGPRRHVRAIEVLLGCQAKLPQQSCPQSPRGCQCYTHLPFFFAGDRLRVGKDAKINYCV